MALPPWLQPQDFIGAMRAGAGLGLSLRAQDQAAEEAAARLALQHDQITAQQAQHAATLAQAEARAAEALRQHNALELYRQKNLERQERVEQAKSAREAMRDALAERRLGLSESRAEEAAKRQDAAAARHDAFLNLAIERENRLSGSKETPVSTLDSIYGKMEEGPAKRALQKTIFSKIGLGDIKTEEELKQEEKRLRDVGWSNEGDRMSIVSALKGLASATPSTGGRTIVPAPAEPPTPSLQLAPSPSKRIRVRSKDGKIGTIPEDQLDAALAEGYTQL